jgi:hypothetical protein
MTTKKQSPPKLHNQLAKSGYRSIEKSNKSTPLSQKLTMYLMHLSYLLPGFNSPQEIIHVVAFFSSAQRRRMASPCKEQGSKEISSSLMLWIDDKDNKNKLLLAISFHEPCQFDGLVDGAILGLVFEGGCLFEERDGVYYIRQFDRS